MTVSAISWTFDWFATKLGLMVHHHKLECPVKIDVTITVKVSNVNKHLARQYILNHSTFCNWTWYELDYHAEKLVCCLQRQGQSKGLCNRNMIVSALSSEMLAFLQLNLAWWWWPFPHLRGFGGNVWPFIPHLRFKKKSLYPHQYKFGGRGGVYWNNFVRLSMSVCLSVSL